MKPRLLVLACFTALAFTRPASAAPVPIDTKNNADPVVAMQMKSIDELLKTLTTTTKTYLPDKLFKEFEKEFLSKLDVSMLKGVDTKKPFGLYASVDASILKGDLTKSTIVAMVPVTDEKEFVALLTAMAELKIEKKGDVYTFPIPDSELEASMRFLKGYAYIGIAGEKLDPKLLLDPSEVIDAKEQAAFAMRLRVDRIPVELKEAAIQFLAQGGDMFKDMAGLPPELVAVFNDGIKTLIKWTKWGCDDGKEFVLRLDLDGSSGSVLVESAFEPKTGTTLAKAISALKPTKNDYASIVTSESAAHLYVQAPLFIEEVQSFLVQLIDVGAKLTADEKKNGAVLEQPDVAVAQRKVVAELFTMLSKSVKSGNVDLAASLRGPDKNEQYTAVGAIGLKETDNLVKALRELMKVQRKDAQDHIKFDAFKIGEINVHEINVGDELPDEMVKVFTKSSIYVAPTPQGVFVTFGAQAKEAMKELVTAKWEAKPAPLVLAEVSGKRMMAFLKSAGAPLDGDVGQFIEKFGKMDKVNAMQIKVQGGDRFVVRYELGLLPLLGTMGLGYAAEKSFEVRPPVEVKPDAKK